MTDYERKRLEQIEAQISKLLTYLPNYEDGEDHSPEYVAAIKKIEEALEDAEAAAQEC